MDVLAKKMTNEWVPTLTALAPDSGCYMSEVNIHSDHFCYQEDDLLRINSRVADFVPSLG